MEDDGGLGIRNWGYYEQPIKNSHLGLQLMPGMMAERNTKPALSNGTFLHRSIGEPSVPMDFVRDSLLHHKEKIMHMLPGNHNGYTMFSDSSEPHSLQMLQTTEQMKDNRILQHDEPSGTKKATSKKKQGRNCGVPKATKPKKVRQPGNVAGNGSGSRLRSVRKNIEIIINGIDLDISRIPTPVCTCTGTPQPCYRWGVGGWQSACCTTTISMHPLPMNTKRRGCRIAGRKMSQGAFKKVLEKLAGEGYNLSNSIDLRSHWAKHGTNKFVTIRIGYIIVVVKGTLKIWNMDVFRNAQPLRGDAIREMCRGSTLVLNKLSSLSDLYPLFQPI